MKGRIGFTLIELILTMTAGTTLMMICIGVLHQSMSLASLAKERSDHAMTMDRLAREFRADVHRSRRVLVTEGTALLLVLDDGSVIEYIAADNRVARQHRSDQSVIGREVFQLSHQSSGSFESIDESTRVALTVLTQPQPRHSARPAGQQPVLSPKLERYVVAVVGKWLTSMPSAEVSP